MMPTYNRKAGFRRISIHQTRCHMKKHLIIIKFSAAELFGQYYRQIKSGQLIVHCASPLPENAAILIKMILPRIHPGILLNCRVLSQKTASGPGCRMSFEIIDNLMLLMAEIDDLFKRDPAYRDMLGLTIETATQTPAIESVISEPEEEIELEMDFVDLKSPAGITAEIQPPPEPNFAAAIECPIPVEIEDLPHSQETLSLEWFRRAVQDETVVPLIQAESDIPEEPCFEKTELTEAEKKRCQPVGSFIMNLTKAMLRSGYYDPGHPGSTTAKSGLYEEFIRVLQDSGEIMISNRSTKEKGDLLITGILDEPVSIHQMVTQGVAGLFVPKLCEYCEKKELIGFAIRKEIPPPHFNDFITIMSDPQVDRSEHQKAGAYLTSALVEHGITMISTVFADDLLKLEQDLPWRVEMAIQRLAKDFRLMPMFAEASDDAVKKMKLATVEDIIRPLKHPRYLNDFLVNSHVIAENVGHMEPEIIEEIIVDAFPVEKLLPTSRFTFTELDYLNQLKSEQPDNRLILRRLSGIRRILKLISRRVVQEDAPGAHLFLEQLHDNQILSFTELPAEVQYIVNSRSMADDFEKNRQSYPCRLSALDTFEDAQVYLKGFSRMLPVFMASAKWEILADMVEILDQAAAANPFFSRQLTQSVAVTEKSDGPVEKESTDTQPDEFTSAVFLFENMLDALADAFQRADEPDRQRMNRLLDRLGISGVEILSRVLSRSNDRDVRKTAVEALQAKGDTARIWALKVIADDGQQWFLHRNAMMILRNVSKQEGDFEPVRKFLKNSHSRLREEAMSLVLSLRPGDMESLIIDALLDADARVRWRALKALADIPSVHAATMDDLLRLISNMFHQQEPAEEDVRNLVQFISAINAMKLIPSGEKVEAVMLEIVKTTAQRSSGWRKLVKKAKGSHQDLSILKAGIPLLGRIGGDLSKKALTGISKTHPPLAQIISTAVGKIEKRL